MNFAYDPTNNFYYCGEEEPRAGLYRDLLLDSSLTRIAYDTETISTKEKIAVGLAIAPTPTEAFYFPMFPEPSPMVPWHLLRDNSIQKIIHNALFDLVALREFEVSVENIQDTTDLARLVGERDATLYELVRSRYSTVLTTAKDLMGAGQTMLDADKDATAKMCCTHAMYTYRLWQDMIGDVDADYYQSEMELIPIMIKMSYRGIKLDQEERQRVEDILTTEASYYKGLCEEEGFSPASPQQVAYTLAQRGAYKVFRRLPFTKDKNGRRTSHLSTDVETLRKMDDPLASIILSYREYSKLLSTYIMPWRGEDRAYTRFHLDAITGRPSSTDRNMQNIPGKFKKDGTENLVNCRGMLLPDSGVWTDADFSQAEPRALAYLSQDKEMIRIFELPKFLPDGSKNLEADIHWQAAVAMDVDRKVGKTFNLAMTYGSSDETLAETIGTKDLGKIAEWRWKWSMRFPQCSDWMASTREFGLHHGYITTILGRKIRVPSLFEESEDGIGRKSIDYSCQGSASEILKRSLKRVYDAGIDIALQTHDQLTMDGHVEVERLKELMENNMPFPTPIEVKYLQRWE
jgi:DNA polymerase I